MTFTVRIPRKPKRKKSRDAEFWNTDVPIIVNNQITQGGMFNHQRAWWEMPNFIRILVGGYGSGKTFPLCKRGLSLAMENGGENPCPVGMISPTYNMARETTISTLQELLAGKQTIYGSGNFEWNYNQSSHVFLINHMGRLGKLIIMSGDNPDSLRGPNLAAACIDEPFIQDEEVFRQVVARVRHPRAKRKEINLTGTPEQLNWGYELAEGELSEKHDVGVVHASTRENLAIQQDYADRLEGALDDKAAAAYVLGQFVHLGKGLVYYGFNPHEHIVRLNIPLGAELGVGMDFNVDPMAAVVFWILRDHMHVFAEIEIPNADTEYMCSVLKERYWARGLRYVYPDASGKNRSTTSPGGKSDFTYIKQAGFIRQCNRNNPFRRDRYNAVNGKFKLKGGKYGLTIDPRCKKLKKYLSTYAHELMNRTNQKAMSHLLDALGYPIAYRFPVDKKSIRRVKVRAA